MKKIILAAITLFVISQFACAQNVGIGTNTPAASAQLDVTSTTKGVLVPRVTTTQMNAIAGPATGLLVYNTTASAFAYRTVSGWVFLTGNTIAGAGWSTLGNAGTNPATNFIGTTDDQPVVVRQNNVRAGLLTGFNTSWGFTALNPASTGTFNTAIGLDALYSNTTGGDNTANGAKALFSNTTGELNTANGVNTLRSNITGNNNTANGTEALYSNTSGFSNVAVGINALFSNTNRSNLVAIGDSALYNNGVGTTLSFQATDNTAVGSKALFANTTGFANTAIGVAALRSNTTGGFNTANGVAALFNNNTGNDNTAIGAKALNSNTGGISNTAIGGNALQSNVEGNFNAAIGRNALLNNTAGNSNTASGVQALSSNTEGSNNTANGRTTLFRNTTGNANVGIGTGALFENTTRSNLVAVGDSALYNNGLGATTTLHATGNTAVGSKALFANNTGFNNTATGSAALSSNAAGNFNTATGSQALNRNTGGSSNTANGAAALFSNTIGSSNTANGLSALRFNTEGSNNTAIGADALLSNTAGNSNTAIGTVAGRNNQTGSGNVFIGNQAGFNETGSNKLYISNNFANALLYGEFDTDRLRIQNKLGIGRLPNTFPLEIQPLAGTDDLLQFFNAAGTAKWHLNLLPNGGLNFTESPAATNRLVLGIGGELGVGKVPLTGNNDSRLQVKQKGIQNGLGIEAPNSTNHWDYYVTTGASADLQLYYNGTIKGTFDNVTGAYTASSDRRLKKDITPQAPVLNNLLQLEAYQYHYVDNQPADRFSNGFMAQEVQKIFPDAVVENTMKDGQTRLGINYQYFTVLAIKGLQEQQQMITKQEERIAKQEQRNATQEERIAKLEALIKTISAKK